MKRDFTLPICVLIDSGFSKTKTFSILSFNQCPKTMHAHLYRVVYTVQHVDYWSLLIIHRVWNSICKHKTTMQKLKTLRSSQFVNKHLFWYWGMSVNNIVNVFKMLPVGFTITVCHVTVLLSCKWASIKQWYHMT